MRGSTCQLNRNAVRAMRAACGQVRKRSRNAKPPTAMWRTLRFSSPAGTLGKTLVPQPVHGAAQALAEGRGPVAELALGLRARVGPVLAEHVHDLVGEQRLATAELGPRIERVAESGRHAVGNVAPGR